MSRLAGWARRDVLRLGATCGTAAGLRAAAGAVRPQPLRVRGSGPGRHHAASGSRLDPTIVIDGTDVRTLALRALDAAKAAGASYADVHLTRKLAQGISCGLIDLPSDGVGSFVEDEKFGLGVRVRVGGGWGFASSPYWIPEEAVALAHEAVVEARANARDMLPVPDWAPIPVAQGHWATPIKVDPFTLTVEEKIDQLQTWMALARRLPNGGGSWGPSAFHREERVVATSEGSYFTQTLYDSASSFGLSRSLPSKQTQIWGHAQAHGLEPCAAGWELFTEADLPGQIPQLYEAADPRTQPPPPPVKVGEVGRYDVVFDAWTAGEILEATLGVATQLDRALGYEANADGTSYLGPDPLALLGNYQAASSIVTMTANRSMPRGIATVKWDDEGVEPEDFTLIKDGILVDYQTTRELAPLLAPWYQKQGKPVRSHGCAWSMSGLSLPVQHMPNLVLEPGKEDVGFDELVASTKKGLAVMRSDAPPYVFTDFQARTGEGMKHEIREITNGKLGPVITGLGFLFASTNLWKNVVALGGPKSVVQRTSDALKGQPLQGMMYSLRTVPMKVKDVDFIDPARRA